MNTESFPKLSRFAQRNKEIVTLLAKIHENSPKEWDTSWKVEQSFIDERVREIGLKVLDDNVLFLLITNKNGEIIGFHWLEFIEEKKLARLKSLWVAKEFRGKGLAKRLKTEGEKWAQLKGAQKMITNVHWMNKKMIDINISQGFNPGFVYLEKPLGK